MIPGALSYAQTILKVPVQYGLFTGIWPLLVYAIFGTSRFLSVGPEAVVALLTAAAINQYAGDADLSTSKLGEPEDPAEKVALRVSTMISLSFLVGLITSSLGFFRLGFLDSVLSRSLLRGFISAVACVVLIEQLPPLTGIDYSNLPKDTSTSGYDWTEQHLGAKWSDWSASRTTPDPSRSDYLANMPGLAVALQDYEDENADDAARHRTRFTSTSHQVSPSKFTASETLSTDEPTPTPSLTTDFSTTTDWTTSTTETPEPTETPPEPVPPAVSSPDLTPIEKLQRFIAHASYVHPPSLLVALCTIAFLLVSKTVKRTLGHTSPIIQLFPDILTALAVADLLSYLFDWEAAGIRVVGPVEAGLVAPVLPTLGIVRIKNLFITAVLISIIGFVESVAVASHSHSSASRAGDTSNTASSTASPLDDMVSPNRELVAMGLANIVSSTLGAWPAFGSLPRSAVARAAGAKTQMFAAVAAVVVLLVAFFLAPLLYPLPIPVLAGVISVACLALLEFDDIAFALRLGAWSDLALVCLTFVTTIVFGIELGTLVSVALSLLLVIKETTSLRMSVLGRARVVDRSAPGGWRYKYRDIDGNNFSSRQRDRSPGPGSEPARGWSRGGDENDEAPPEEIPGLLVVRIEEDLFFGNCGQIRERLRRAEAYGTLRVHPGSEPPANRAPVKAVVIDMEGVSSADASTARIIYEIVEAHSQRGIAVCFVHLRPAVRDLFLRSGIWDAVGASGGGVYDRVRDSVEAMEDRAAEAAAIAEARQEADGDADDRDEEAGGRDQPGGAEPAWVSRIFGGGAGGSSAAAGSNKGIVARRLPSLSLDDDDDDDAAI